MLLIAPINIIVILSSTLSTFPGPTLLLTSDIIKQRLGAAALDKLVMISKSPPPSA